MKTLTLFQKFTSAFALLALVCLFNAKSFAQCQANFTWSQTSPNVITFTDASTGTSIYTNYYWDFGNGDYDYNQNPIHTFSAPGVYNVCLTISDSNFVGCSSTFCDSITVTGSVICNLNLTAYQLSGASCQTCADGSASAYTTGGTAPYTYLWSNLATTSSVSGLLPGSYSVCVTDASGCTACSGTLTIDYTSCNANFTWAQNGPNAINFSDASTGTNFTTSYYWDFGDGNYDFTQNPVHTYNAPGEYNVCLYISDTSTTYCSSSFCDSVIVTGNVLCGLTINAYEYSTATCSTCADGEAYAYASGGTPPYNYLWSTGATTTYVPGLLPGTYSVCATDANGCTACSNVTITDSSIVCSANFYLYPDSTTPHTYYAVNLSNGSPNASYLWSWGDGNYDTAQYPSHTYASAGFYTICLTVTDTNCSSTFCDSTFISRPAQGLPRTNLNSIISVNVISPSTVGIHTNTISDPVSVYPNPVTSILTVAIPGTGNHSTAYKVFSLEGAEILNGLFSEKENKLNLENLKQGIYLLEIKNENGLKMYRKLVKE